MRDVTELFREACLGSAEQVSLLVRHRRRTRIVFERRTLPDNKAPMSIQGDLNGANRLCDSFMAQGVDTYFANSGTSKMHFVAALDQRPEMRCVLGLSEGVAKGAADGYARMADKSAAMLLHLGPGLANGLANSPNAKGARSPVIHASGTMRPII